MARFRTPTTRKNNNRQQEQNIKHLSPKREGKLGPMGTGEVRVREASHVMCSHRKCPPLPHLSLRHPQHPPSPVPETTTTTTTAQSTASFCAPLDGCHSKRYFTLPREMPIAVLHAPTRQSASGGHPSLPANPSTGYFLPWREMHIA